MTIDSRAVLAAANNADWYAMMFYTHDLSRDNFGLIADEAQRRPDFGIKLRSAGSIWMHWD